MPPRTPSIYTQLWVQQGATHCNQSFQISKVWALVFGEHNRLPFCVLLFSDTPCKLKCSHLYASSLKHIYFWLHRARIGIHDSDYSFYHAVMNFWNLIFGQNVTWHITSQASLCEPSQTGESQNTRCVCAIWTTVWSPDQLPFSTDALETKLKHEEALYVLLEAFDISLQLFFLLVISRLQPSQLGVWESQFNPEICRISWRATSSWQFVFFVSFQAFH